ncbi:IclR family transcriptional regulator [Allonocardiopsis opalescens]|uniref:Glycerol operon regulatory protein n=1 Tax=Allonocardiopsis opalescens TaxID=1144618 RepID=A0A2T0QFF6_9ACTN|nr:IclR family transcriptional regulator [Allonocardiopsis opalescens]PRY02666.1 IclR family transcriptional regulator [Allonocardiopsis opalescens]
MNDSDGRADGGARNAVAAAEGGAGRRGDGVQSVERTLDVLEALAAAGGQLGLSEISARTGLPYGTTHRLLRTLIDRGYVRQDADRKYALGAALLRLGNATEQLFGSWAGPYLARLVELSGETANLAVMEGDAVVYVAQASSPRWLRMFTEVGRRVLPHCTAVGKVLLAERTDAECAALLRRTGLPRHTASTITEPAAMLAELARVRTAGYAVDRGEQELEVRCVAVPVRHRGEVIAALSVSGPASRMAGHDLRTLVARMHTVAEEFSAEVLGRG